MSDVYTLARVLITKLIAASHCFNSNFWPSEASSSPLGSLRFGVFLSMLKFWLTLFI